MGQTGGKTNSRSGSTSTRLLRKDLKLTVIFAPVSRSELLDIYNPIEYPCVDREMRVISRQVSSSGDYVSEEQDKVIYINCSSIEVQTACASEGSLPMLVSVDSSTMLDKLERAVQLVHELLDYWHGYGGTVFTTFCCYQPLEDLMVALQSILGCPGSSSAQDAEFFSDASVVFCDSFNQYKQWTFVNKHSSVYKAEYKYESYNGKSEEENLKDANENMFDNLKEIDEEAWRRFREYQDATGMSKTTAMYGVEGYIKSHPEFAKYYDELKRNNRRLEEIDEANQKFAEEWSEKSHGQRLGYAHNQINKQYDPQIKAAEAEEKRNKRYLDEINEKMKQLDWQQGKKSQFTSDRVTQRSYDAFDIGEQLHGETHSRDTIEYNGEYYTREELDQMYWAMKGRLGSKKKALEAKKEKAWRQAQEDIRKQMYVETVNAGVAIFGIVAIILAPLAIVDIIVIIGKMATIEDERNADNWIALGLDIFGLIPFVGAAFKLGGVVGKVSHVAVSETIASNLAAKGEKAIANAISAAAPAGGFVSGLPVVSLGGFVNDLNLFLKNLSYLKLSQKLTVVGNIGIQAVGQYGTFKGAYDSISTLASGPSYTAKSNGDDFVIVVKN